MVMVAERDQRELVAPNEQEVGHIQELEHFLHERAQRPAKLVAPDGSAQIDIPAPVYEVLRLIVPLMAQGAAIGLVPLHQELTTQQAADLLNTSRPSLTKLLDSGEIHYQKTEGGHRRVRFVDVMAYKDRRSAIRHAAFVEMAAIGQKYGAYETNAADALFGVDLDETDADLDETSDERG